MCTRHGLLINKLHQEIKTILRNGSENKGNSFILTSLVLIILINNFLGLFPYIFNQSGRMHQSRSRGRSSYSCRQSRKKKRISPLFIHNFSIIGVHLFLVSLLGYEFRLLNIVDLLNFIIHFYFSILKESMAYVSRSQWPRGLRCRSSAARLL